MAYLSLTRALKNAQKRGVCLMTAIINEGTNAETDIDGITTGGVNYKIGNLPENAIIQDAYVFVETVSDAATSAVIDIGTTEGGTEIVAAADAATLGDQGTAAAKQDTGTGVEVFLTKTTTGVATNVGEYVVVIEYVEYEKATGEYTSLEG